MEQHTLFTFSENKGHGLWQCAGKVQSTRVYFGLCSKICKCSSALALYLTSCTKLSALHNYMCQQDQTKKNAAVTMENLCANLIACGSNTAFVKHSLSKCWNNNSSKRCCYQLGFPMSWENSALRKLYTVNFHYFSPEGTYKTHWKYRINAKTHCSLTGYLPYS